MNKQQLHKWQDRFFTTFIYFSYMLLILSAFGLSDTVPKFLQSLDYYVRIYICLFLIWRFNPLRSFYEFTDLDRKIAFTAGLFILTTTALNQYIEQLKTILKNIL